MRVNVVTPTYNRAYLLPRLYKSLCEQTSKDFEWLVVDDGSSDNTEEVIQSFIKEGILQIRYLRKPNGGKHTAINLAAREANSELFFIADSDDWLPKTSIQDVIEVYSSVRSDERFAGICGLDQYANGTIVGSGLTESVIDATPQEIREKWGVKGDLKEVFRTSVMREYPFPEIEGEKFCPEVLVWNRIGKKNKLRYFNKPIYTVEYQPDGLTGGITRARMGSPVASMMTYSEWFEQADSFKVKFRMAINYWRFALCSRKRYFISIANWGKLLLPFGVIYHVRDLLNARH